MSRLKVTLAATLLLTLAVFVAQNVQVVDVRFLAWKIEMSRAILLLVVLGIGIAIGWLASSVLRLRS